MRSGTCTDDKRSSEKLPNYLSMTNLERWSDRIALHHHLRLWRMWVLEERKGRWLAFGNLRFGFVHDQRSRWFWRECARRELDVVVVTVMVWRFF